VSGVVNDNLQLVTPFLTYEYETKQMTNKSEQQFLIIIRSKEQNVEF